RITRGNMPIRTWQGAPRRGVLPAQRAFNVPMGRTHSLAGEAPTEARRCPRRPGSTPGTRAAGTSRPEQHLAPGHGGAACECRLPGSLRPPDTASQGSTIQPLALLVITSEASGGTSYLGQLLAKRPGTHDPAICPDRT